MAVLLLVLCHGVESGSPDVLTGAPGLHAGPPGAADSLRSLVNGQSIDRTELIPLPFGEQRPLRSYPDRSAQYRFQAIRGQTLDVRLDREPQTDESARGVVYIDLFRIGADGNGHDSIPATEFTIGIDTLSVTLPAAGEYVLRLEPEALVDLLLAVRLELGAVLAFPVEGRRLDDVRSRFGAARDGGTRRHEGIDIYAPRSTPVLAVSAGRAVSGSDEVGGRVVRLNTPGVTYYYAHLERVAIDGPKWVQPGEVLGYVGNSGNAVHSPPHLHFGLYTNGSGALDPAPLLRELRFPQHPAPATSAALPVSGELVVDRSTGPVPFLIAANGRLAWLPRQPGEPPSVRVAAVANSAGSGSSAGERLLALARRSGVAREPARTVVIDAL